MKELCVREVMRQESVDADQYRGMYLPEYLKKRRIQSDEARALYVELLDAATYVCQRTNGEVNGYSRLNAAVIACREGEWDPVQGEPV